MGLQVLTEPHLFMGGLTATGNIFGARVPTLITSYYSWTSTSNIVVSSFPIPLEAGVIFEGPNNSGNYIVSIGGVVQSPTQYTIDPVFRNIAFNAPVSAGVEIFATQLGTVAQSAQNLETITALSAEFVNLSAINNTLESIDSDYINTNNIDTNDINVGTKITTLMLSAESINLHGSVPLFNAANLDAIPNCVSVLGIDVNGTTLYIPLLSAY